MVAWLVGWLVGWFLWLVNPLVIFAKDDFCFITLVWLFGLMAYQPLMVI